MMLHLIGSVSYKVRYITYFKFLVEATPSINIKIIFKIIILIFVSNTSIGSGSLHEIDLEWKKTKWNWQNSYTVEPLIMATPE